MTRDPTTFEKNQQEPRRSTEYCTGGCDLPGELSFEISADAGGG